MTSPATPSPPPPTAIPPPGSAIPPPPRRSSTWNGSSRAPLRKRTDEVLPRRCGVLNAESGADGARTRGLQHAMLALSQLSYGPNAAQCSAELEVPGPVDSSRLVVTRRVQAKRNMRPAREELVWQEVARVVRRAVRREGIDLAGLVDPLQEPSRTAPARIAPDDDDVAFERRPFALDSHQRRPNREDEVVAPAFDNRSVDLHA